MTKEELKTDESKYIIELVIKDKLKKEAEECMHNALFWLKLPVSKENVEQGGSYILKLLEPREKRIAELEDKLANADYQLEGRDLEIKELEKENAELKDNFKIAKDNEYEYSSLLTKAKEIILRLYNAGRDVLMCRAEEKAYDNLSNAINDKSIEQFLSEV